MQSKEPPSPTPAPVGGDDLLHPRSEALFGCLFVVQLIYVLDGLTGEGGPKDFFKYWSCWNYLVNLAFFLVLACSVYWWAKFAACAAAPYVFALDLLWAGLSAMIAGMGALAGPDGDDGKLTVAYLEGLAGTAYLHFGPVIVLGAYCFVEMPCIREVYAGLVPRGDPSTLVPRVIGAAIMLWAPWLFFWLYTLTQDPYTVYGVEEPSLLWMAVIVLAGLAVYSSVMVTLLVLTYRQREPKYMTRKPLQKLLKWWDAQLTPQ